MGNFYNKHFNKSKSIKVIVYCEDRRVRTYYVVPNKDGKTVTIKALSKTFFLTVKENEPLKYHFIDNKNFPTYLYTYDRLEPINPTDAKNLGTRKPAEMKEALDAKVIHDLFNSLNGGLGDAVWYGIIIGVMVVGFIALYYGFSNELKAIKEIIQPQVTQFITGGR